MAMRPSSGANPVVFVGPTLRVSEAERILKAEYLPPAAQGSFVEAVQQFRPPAILLIDGVFQGEPAVRHKEILWTMAQGIPVFGSASMGALRAAELWRYGMVGIGLIFRWYRRYQFTPDDAVAVLHGPPEIGSPPLTQSLVDLRIIFRLAEKNGVIGNTFRHELVNAARCLNFRDRTIPEIANVAFRSCPMRPADRQAILEGLSDLRYSQKREDALTALYLFGKLLSENRVSPPASPQFRLTNAFVRDLQDAGLSIS